MAKEFQVDFTGATVPVITKSYNAPGLSWQEAKKQLRAWFVTQASGLRKVKQKDYFSHVE